MQNEKPSEPAPSNPAVVPTQQPAAPPPPVPGGGQQPVTISPTEISSPQPAEANTNTTTVRNPSGIDVSSIYSAPAPTPITSVNVATPVATSVAQEHITGSKLAQEKVKMPIGVYIVAAWTLIGFVASFLNTSQNSEIISIGMLLDLFLAIGLLLRIEFARKAMVWVSAILIVVSAILIVLIVRLQQDVKSANNKFNYAVSQINQQQLTPQDQQALSNIKAQIKSDNKKIGKAIGIVYVEEGSTIVVNLVVIIYITRPKVKEAFKRAY